MPLMRCGQLVVVSMKEVNGANEDEVKTVKTADLTT
jgi:hypothetical protein